MTNQELLAAGHAAFNAGEADRAIATLGQVTSADPGVYAQALLLLGRSYMRKADYEQARLCMEESYSVRRQARTLFHLGECYYQAGDKAHADECLEAATNADDTLTDAYILMGMTRREMGRAREAIPCFDRALKNDPKAVVARYQLAQVSFDLGDLQRSAAQAHHVIQQADDFAPAHLLMAHITLKMGDFRQAAVEFCRVLDLKGPDPLVYLALGRAFAQLQDLPQALLAFEACFAVDPENEQACSAAARLAERKGEKEKAVKYYRELLSFEGSVPMATDALTRLGAAAPTAASAKKGKDAKRVMSKEAKEILNTRFQPPKSLEKGTLPGGLPARPTGRLITERGTQPLRTEGTALPSFGPGANAPGRPVPPRPVPAPPAVTTPLDKMIGNLNRLIDKTPLQGRIDAKAVNDAANNVAGMANNMQSNVNSMVDKLRSTISAKVKREVPVEPPPPPRPGTTGGLQRPPGPGLRPPFPRPDGDKPRPK